LERLDDEILSHEWQFVAKVYTKFEAHWGCHGSEAKAMPFINLTGEMSEWPSNVMLYAGLDKLPEILSGIAVF
jgi:hypothetical protein